jgi:hypothetical protein
MSPPVSPSQAARDEFDRQELFRRVNQIEIYGCGVAHMHKDHEERIRRVEEIAIALGTLPADHEKRLRSLEKVVVWFAGVSAVLAAVATSGVATIWKKVWP